MQVIVNDILHNQQSLTYDRDAGFTVGSAPYNQVVLNRSRFVAPLHLTVDYGSNGWTATVASGAAPVEIDGVEVAPGTVAVLRPLSMVRIASYYLVLRQDSESTDDAATVRDATINRIQREIHQKVIARINSRGESDNLTPSRALFLQISSDVDSIIKTDYQRELGPNGNLRPTLLRLAISKLLRHSDDHNNPLANDSGALHDLTLAYLNRAKQIPPESLNDQVAVLLTEMPENVQFHLIGIYLKITIGDLIFGFGPLQNLLDLPNVSEIMVVSPSLIYIEQNGKVIKTGSSFLGDAELMTVLERIVSPLGRRIDRSSPLVDARLPDGSRVNAVIPPLALKGPCLTIRRFPEERITAEHLLKWGSITEAALALLSGLVRGRKSIIVAGGTGSGKTTMLNVISNFIPEKERLVTIEDSAELQIPHEHLVSLESRPANVEGKGEVSIRDLIKNALRMRPDRIIVGECRGAEAFDMLQAMNTGHNGSLTTVHANSPEDVMTRLEAMCLMAVDIPLVSLRQQISQAIDFVVYLARLENGQRMTTAIAEVGGIDPKTGKIQTRIVMRANFHPDDQRYYLENNGYIPAALPELASKGLVDVHKVYPS